MRTIRLPNPRLVNTERTFLDADYNPTQASPTVLTVLNNVYFALNDYAVVGEVGEEKTEQQLVSSISGATTININAAFALTHNKTTPIYKSKWNQWAIEGMQGSASWQSLITQDIQWNKLETLFFHTAGDDTWNYRARLYNSQTGLYSEYTPTASGAGFTAFQVGTMVINVRRKVRDPNRVRISDTDIINLLQQGQVDIQFRIPELWFLEVNTFSRKQIGVLSTSGIAATANTFIYSLSQYTDFDFLTKMRYNFINGANNLLWDLEPLPDIEFDRYKYNLNQVADDNVRRVRLIPPDSNSAPGYFEVYPTPKSTGVGTFYPTYFRKMTALKGVSDTTDLPFPEIIEDYAAWRIHKLLGNEQQATMYQRLYAGPNYGNQNEPLTGIALLAVYDKNQKNSSLGYGKQLWRYRGRKGRSNFFGHGIASRDYLKENYM